MRASLFFRTASVLSILFAGGHTAGFRNTDPQWGADATVASMKSVRFAVQGFNRSYWDFFVGFGFFVSVFLVFAAVIAWQLGRLSGPALASMRVPAWALTVSFGVIAVLSWRYFFIVPLAFSVLIFVCLLAGTLMSQRAS
jgi:hypothetical protein